MVFLNLHTYIGQPFCYLSVCSSVYLSACLSACLSIYPSVVVEWELSSKGQILGPQLVVLFEEVVLNEICHWGQGLRVHSMAPLVLTFCFVFVIKDIISQFPAPIAMPAASCQASLLSQTLTLWNQAKVTSAFSKLLLDIVFHHIHRKATDMSSILVSCFHGELWLVDRVGSNPQ